MFKSVLSSIAVIVAFAPSAQAVEFVNTDGSKLSQICIAAAESKNALTQEMRAQSINKAELTNISCNDMSLTRFAKKYRSMNSTEVVNVVAFENVNASNEAELCIAAATSNQDFQQAKKRYFNRFSADEVLCNGEKLATFAKQFNKSFND